MKKYKRIIPIILGLSLFLFLLVGCINNGSTDNGDSNNGDDSDMTVADDATREDKGEVQADIDQDEDNTIIEEPLKISMIIPDGKIARYLKFDAPYFKQYMSAYAPNSEIQIVDSEGDQQKQLQQVEAAIANDADAVVLLPVDSNNAGGMLTTLHDENVLTLTYAHEGYGGPVDFHCSTPFTTIGENHAQHMDKTMRNNPKDEPYKVAMIWGEPGFAFYDDLKSIYSNYLEQWEKDGLVEVVYESDTEGWNATVSEPVATQMLTETQNDVDIILTMNDDLATGIISALNAQGLAGDVLIYGGCDATLEGIARVQAGWQITDISPDYEQTANAAAQLIAYTLAGEELPDGLINGTFDNSYVQGGVPTAYIDSLLVTKDNLKDLIVDTGIYTQEQIDEIANNMK